MTIRSNPQAASATTRSKLRGRGVRIAADRLNAQLALQTRRSDRVTLNPNSR